MITVWNIMDTDDEYIATHVNKAAAKRHMNYCNKLFPRFPASISEQEVEQLAKQQVRIDGYKAGEWFNYRNITRVVRDLHMDTGGAPTGIVNFANRELVVWFDGTIWGN